MNTLYRKPSWANWKTYSQALLIMSEVGNAKREAERIDLENSKVYEGLELKKSQCIKDAEAIWGSGSRQVQYLKKQKIESPPVWRKLFWKFHDAVMEARTRSDRNAKARNRRQEKKRLAEIEAQIVERYGSGWVEQEGS